MRGLVSFFIAAVVFSSCSVQQRMTRSAQKTILEHPALQSAHIGISILDAATGAYLFNHQGDKYFVPASNIKIATCYAAMKYLPDSLPGIYYEERPDSFVVYATGDPTLLHPHFKNQNVLHFLQGAAKPISLSMQHWQDDAWGSGWSWNDYEYAYMAERTAMPLYGNVVRFSDSLPQLKVSPKYFSSIRHDSVAYAHPYPDVITRALAANDFSVTRSSARNTSPERAFYTDDGKIVYRLLEDTLHKPVTPSFRRYTPAEKYQVIYSQPADSVLLPMMHNSDNFFAEQLLLMVSHQRLGVMNDAVLIDTLIQTDLKSLPHKPRWVDGSGLSRYNLFTPQDFVQILHTMQQEYGMNRLTKIFPTGNEGTLTGYYQKDSSFIYAKTGTLSGVVALSGYLITAKNRMLIFSILVNNHQASAVQVRRSIESFLGRLRSRM